MRKILTLIAILISVTITTISVHAETYAEAWLRKQQEADEKYMDELEADGNLTQEAIDSLGKGKSKRKPNKKSNTTTTTQTTPSTNTSTYDNPRGWVYSVDELHIIGLPEDSETGYTKAGDYGVIY